MKTYYVHSKKIYDSEREHQELTWLQQFGEVINPNDGDNSPGRDYIQPVLDCNRVVCSEYNKCIGRGAFEQISAALKAGKQVFVMRPRKIIGGFRLKRVKAVKRLFNNWSYFGTIRTRGWNRKVNEGWVMQAIIRDDYLRFKEMIEF